MKKQTIIGLAAAGVVAGAIGAHSIAKTGGGLFRFLFHRI